MTPTLLLVHGWGRDSGFWWPLLRRLADWPVVAWDLGFHGQPSRPALPKGRPVVAVGHSFGLLWLLHEKPVDWAGLVSINGFPRFTQAEDFPEGVAPRLVERMIARFAAAPEAVHGDFMQRCGVSHPCNEGLSAPALAGGLHALAEWDCRGAGKVDLALAGRGDPIVSPAMTEGGFAGTPIEWQDGGHLLPLTAPDWCAERLRQFVGSLP